MNEQIVRFGPDDSLCGILSRPDAREADAPGIVLLNAAMEHRAGPGRFYVKLARALAEKGFPVLRFDFSGVGDSGPRRDGLPFERSAVEETRAALEVLAAESACRRFALVGLCSGATISFKAACADPRVIGATLINAPRYLDELGSEALTTIWRRNQASHYRHVKMFDWRSWHKLLSGRSHYVVLLGAGLTKLRELARARRPFRADSAIDGAAFERLGHRGVQLLLIFSEGDWGLEYLRVVLGPQVSQWMITKNPRVEVVEGTDHILTRLESQERVQRLILEWGAGMSSPRRAVTEVSTPPRGGTLAAGAFSLLST